MPHARQPRARARYVAVLAAGVLTLAGCTTGGPEDAATGPTSAEVPEPTTSAQPPTTGPAVPASPAPTSAASTPTAVAGPPRALLDGLDRPWSIAVLPDGSALVSVRNTADVHLVPPGGEGQGRRVGRVPGVEPFGEGGLLGLAVAPDFAADPVVYAYTTTAQDNRVVAMTWEGGALGAPRPILTGIPRSRNHNGGRLAFGPDGQLYVTTGDAATPSRSQDVESLGGKILRITPDGDPAPGNPFPGSPVWSLGHRNVQGIAWDAAGRMYASEFGANTWDELNLIERGRNYGWPVVEGRAGDDRFVDPLVQWRPADASPSGIAIGPDGAVYLAALRGRSVWRVPLTDGAAGQPERYLDGTYGRVRDVVFTAGRAWILTNDGGDDRLLSLPWADVGAA